MLLWTGPVNPKGSTMLSRFTEPAYRSPMDANDLLLRITQGCTWNRCRFCYMSKQFKFMYVSYEEMEEQLEASVGGYPANTKIWFVGSNPLVLATDRLLHYIQQVGKYYPKFSAITMQSRLTDVKHKSMEELKALREAGLKEIFLGLESGDDEILKLLDKGLDSATALEQMKRLNEADIDIVPMYMLGAGGKGTSEKNALHTAKVLNQVRSKAISTTGLTVFKGSPFWEMRKNGNYIEMPEVEKIKELVTFIEHFTGNTFLYALHYLNPVHFQAHLPAEKEKILGGLHHFLESNSPEEIEQMVNRKNKISI